MFVPRHQVDLELSHCRGRYDYELDSARQWLPILHDPRRSDGLIYLASAASHVYDNGLRIGADPAVVAWALTVAARANTAVFVFSDLVLRPRPWRLDTEGRSVTFDRPTSESSVHSGRWVDAAQQAVIARQHDCLAELLIITYDQLSRSSTRTTAPKRDYHYTELNLVLAAAALDPDRPLAKEYEYHAARSRPAKVKPAAERSAAATLRVVEAIDQRDTIAFNTALFEKLQHFREAVSAGSDEYRRNTTALYPLGNIALAVLAHDRGIRVEVESDYLPRPWVTGELFRPTKAV